MTGVEKGHMSDWVYYTIDLLYPSNENQRPKPICFLYGPCCDGLMDQDGRYNIVHTFLDLHLRKTRSIDQKENHQEHEYTDNEYSPRDYASGS
jgi:hypothetical protein